MNKKSIVIEVEARYFMHPNPSDIKNKPVNFLWMVAHGYAQLAEFFIKHFKTLSDEHAVIAPEGLHRFYIEKNSGRVGASWMTKLERETDIDQYIRLFDDILQKEMANLSECGSKPKIVALGFSQGAATISRWICNTSFNIDVLILWAGAWPHDLDVNFNIDKLSQIEIFIVVGDHDEYMGEQGVSKYLQVFDQSGVSYTLITFEGAHQMHNASLLNIADNLEN